VQLRFILSSRTNLSISYFNLSKDAVKTAVQQVAYSITPLQYTGGPLIERRRAKRFQVDWQIRVESIGGSSVQSGTLRNISSTGALLSVASPLKKGRKLDVYIRLPLSGKKWMKYPAKIVRIEPAGTAVKFDASRPDFKSPLSPV